MALTRKVNPLPGVVTLSAWAAKIGISRQRAQNYVDEGRINVWRVGPVLVVQAGTSQPPAIGRKLKSQV
jgi:predicted site-specific integrase-resolvase